MGKKVAGFILYIILLSYAHIALPSGQRDSKVSNDQQENAIPFIMEKRATMPHAAFDQSQAKQSMGMSSAEELILNLSIPRLKDIIKKVKDDVCQINKGGSFEISVTLDASGKVMGIGASAESGLKVNIVCEK